MVIFCDSVILIYFLDHVGALQARAAHRLAALTAAGDRIAVSDLIRMECRVGPLRVGDRQRLAAFDRFFAQPDVLVLPLTTAVLDRATAVRAQHGFRSVDAINLATAVEHGCDRFLTNDTRLSRFPDVGVEILP
jgi:predicted nucleic acid-binding protein